MPEVNETPAPQLPPVKKKHLGKKKLPEDRRRVILSVRILPSTMEYLTNMGYRSNGRALDVLVKSLQHPGVVKMLEAQEPVGIVNLLS